MANAQESRKYLRGSTTDAKFAYISLLSHEHVDNITISINTTIIMEANSSHSSLCFDCYFGNDEKQASVDTCYDCKKGMCEHHVCGFDGEHVYCSSCIDTLLGVNSDSDDEENNSENDLN